MTVSAVKQVRIKAMYKVCWPFDKTDPPLQFDSLID